jgi:hypothetical protein
MKITLSVDIACQPEELFPWIAEPEKAMLWQKGIKGGEILHEKPEKVGTTYRFCPGQIDMLSSGKQDTQC